MSDTQTEQIQLIKRIHQWKMAFYGLIILLAGIVIGVCGTLLVGPYRPADQKRNIEFINERMIRHLQHRLNLDPQQRRQVQMIMQTHMKTLDDIREQARPQIAEIMNELYVDIRAVLDEQQQQAWDESIWQLREHVAGPEEGGPGPGSQWAPGAGPGHEPWRRPEPHSRPVGPRGGRFDNRPFDFWERPPHHERPLPQRRGPGGPPDDGRYPRQLLPDDAPANSPPPGNYTASD